MIPYRAVITLRPDVLSRGPQSNPTRSFILGVPTGGGFGVGCIITVPGRADIPAGLHADAVIEVVEAEEFDVSERIATVMPLWYGGIIGEARDLVRLGPGDDFPGRDEAG